MLFYSGSNLMGRPHRVHSEAAGPSRGRIGSPVFVNMKNRDGYSGDSYGIAEDGFVPHLRHRRGLAAIWGKQRQKWAAPRVVVDRSMKILSLLDLRDSR